jgi:hypothetical protein
MVADNEYEYESLAPLIDLSDAPILNFNTESEGEKGGVVDVSAKLSQRLMQGWAIMDDVCTDTLCTGNVPLMRDRSGQVVQCDGKCF